MEFTDEDDKSDDLSADAAALRQVLRRRPLRAVVSGASAGVLASALLGAMLLAPAASMASEAPVGEVSLLIGSARVSASRMAAPQPLQSRRCGSGSATASRRHAERARARPLRRQRVRQRPARQRARVVQALQVTTPAIPQGNEVRLSVEQGTSRSISGRATEVDKIPLSPEHAAGRHRRPRHRFPRPDHRLRACGPRVADGAIVVGARWVVQLFSAAGLGPCTVREQTSVNCPPHMGRLMVEVRRGDEVARLVPAGRVRLLASAAGAAT
jgi:hypothetical protein